jgi:hypothetical protein
MFIISTYIKMNNKIKQHILDLLTNQLQDFELMDGGQQRTVGDLIEHKVIEILFNSKGEIITETKKSTGKKSTEDVTLISNGVSYYIDPKTHNINSDFSMPNLTAIEKLKKIIHTPNCEMMYILVNYEIVNKMVMIKGFDIFFLWEIDCSILGIGALGRGQLQLKDANKELIFTDKGKEGWFEDFKEIVQEFFQKQLVKINKQILDWK